MKSIDGRADGASWRRGARDGGDEQHDGGEAGGSKQGHSGPFVGDARSRDRRRPDFPALRRQSIGDVPRHPGGPRDSRETHAATTVERMRELTQTEAIDLVGRFEAGQEIPERMRADVRMLGSLLGRCSARAAPPVSSTTSSACALATIHAYTDEIARGVRARRGDRRLVHGAARRRGRAGVHRATSTS